MSAFDGAMTRAGVKVEEKMQKINKLVRRAATDSLNHFFEPVYIIYLNKNKKNNYYFFRVLQNVFAHFQQQKHLLTNYQKK